MRPLVSIASLCLSLAAGSGCATAAAGPAGPAGRVLHGDEFDRVRGEYALEDGRVARLAGTRRHPRWELDGDPPRTLRVLSATEFASEDGCLRVVFEAPANASVAQVRVTRRRACAAP